ncbi:MAG TPA: maleylacetate reductase [Burkholderiaceae bacterium]|nr:maleylacetate reductase [Burkholderiaceae bacterium]
MRVVFGVGSLAQLPAELERLGAKRALVLSTPEQAASAAQVAKALGSRAAGTFDRAVMHVPLEIAEAARRMARELEADCCVTVGGGSTTGLGKAIALDSGLAVVAVPTTYAGSEMTPIYGLTEGGQKKTGRDVRVLPKTVVYDPDLTMTLPLALSVTSGLNAIAHAAEGLYTPEPNPIVALMAEEGIAALARALPVLHADIDDRHARHDALYGAWLCGAVLGHVAMGLHHKLCHTLGGTFNLPHAETHTVVLPHALAYNAAAAPEAMARIARALGRADGGDPLSAARALHALATRLGAPTALRDIGMPADGLDRAADLAVQTPYPNPRALERPPLRALLQRAFDGAPPQT